MTRKRFIKLMRMYLRDSYIKKEVIPCLIRNKVSYLEYFKEMQPQYFTIRKHEPFRRN